ncbi:YIP1 family protein [Methanogenium organophilum]|uniref:YIP1 family protein n=1 Tax=Methanogenium organophilum TaxID=2199 RepID=A0A9X9T696_METOG|nr:YIP1 family protein [Methanogenium organophilum]WAI00173.1 YIP1 family protein [Methanogenium organophilum]
MSTGFLDKVKGFLLDPTQTLVAHRDESFGDAMRYFILFLVIYGVLTGVVLGLLMGMLGGMAGAQAGMGALGAGGLAALGVLGMVIASIIFIIIFGVIALFIGGVLLHIFVYIAGGRKGLTTTVRAVIYSLTPNLIFGWIPLIGFVAGFWTLALEILAIKELHEISTTRAFIAVFLPAILLAVIAFFILAALVAVTPATTYY